MATIERPKDGSKMQATFSEMKQGNADDWAIIGGQYRAFAKGVSDRVLDHLRLLEGDFGGFPVCRL